MPGSNLEWLSLPLVLKRFSLFGAWIFEQMWCLSECCRLPIGSCPLSLQTLVLPFKPLCLHDAALLPPALSSSQRLSPWPESCPIPMAGGWLGSKNMRCHFLGAAGKVLWDSEKNSWCKFPVFPWMTLHCHGGGYVMGVKSGPSQPTPSRREGELVYGGGDNGEDWRKMHPELPG